MKLLSGKPVADAINEDCKIRIKKLNDDGVLPMLALLRIGEDPSDMAYERNAVKRAETCGLGIRKIVLPGNVTEEQILEEIRKLNDDPAIHGCLIFRPLPSHISDQKICNALVSEKDIDGITDGSLAGVFSGDDKGFPPCTAQACLELLNHYHIELSGKKVVVVGRSLVIGKPVAMMLLKRNATVTICHTKTNNLSEEIRQADIVIAAAGKAGLIDKTMLRSGQVVLDVGINFDAKGKMVGDVSVENDENTELFLTPVPGGIGTITNSVLVKHVVEAAEKRAIL